MPGGSAMKLKTPRSFETTVWGRMSASLASVTETPGRTAFCSSVTTPVIVPVCICAAARDGTDSTMRAAKSPRVVFTMDPPCLAASCFFSVGGGKSPSQRHTFTTSANKSSIVSGGSGSESVRRSSIGSTKPALTRAAISGV
jgi:hypothetical protein